MIKTIFFDFDGTISDARMIAFNSLVRTLEEFGYDFDEKRLMSLLGVKMKGMLKMLGLKVKDVEAIRDKFYTYFTEMAVAGGIRPCVSLKPLWKMKGEGMPMYVISNSRDDFLKASIKKLRIEGLFTEVYGAERFKHKDDMMSALFKKMKLKPCEVIYVGDRFSDIEFAREAGCVAVAIHNKCSFSTLDRIKEEEPDFIVRDFYGLGKIVGKLNNSG
ncbi:HAD family hydrolase [archaeon]|nr:HAD family hydrolase [archaeon]